jgi:hypothetical protein
MAFADEFATCMQGGGFNIDAGIVPEAGELGAAIDYLKSWISVLGSDAAAAIDNVTDSSRTAVMFADSEIAAMSDSYVGLLQAFDAVSGMPISASIQWCEYCIQQTLASASQE